MKRLLLFIILLFGLFPVFENGDFKITGGNIVHGQNVANHLVNYLSAQDPSHGYVNAQHGCGCAVMKIDLTTGTVIQFIYVDAAYVAANPGFQTYLQNGGVPPPPPPPDPEEDDDSEYTMEDFLQDFAEFEERIREFHEMMDNYWQDGGGYGGGNEPVPPQTRECISEWSSSEGVAEKNDGYNHQVNDGPTDCSDKKYFLKFKHLIKFSPAQRVMIQKYYFDGGTLIAIKVNDKIYTNAQRVEFAIPGQKCPAFNNGPGNGGDGMDHYTSSTKVITGRSGCYKFICFQNLVDDNLKPLYYDNDLQIWIDLPYNDTRYCIEAEFVKEATAGDYVLASNSTAQEYCYELTPEDVKKTTRVGRDDEFHMNLIHFEHYVNVPDWVRKYVKKLGLMPSACLVNYVNDRLAELHADQTYTNASELKQAKMEFESLGYGMLFGFLYCVTDEGTAQGRSAPEQFSFGVLHEVVASLDVKEIVKGIAQLVENASANIVESVEEIIDEVKDAVIDQVLNDDIDFEELAKIVLRAIVDELDDDYEQIKQVAESFKKTYFTECDQDPHWGDICAYRYGQVTAMAVPIVITSGEWLLARLPLLRINYVAYTKDALDAVNDAINLSRQIIDEPYTLVLDDLDNIPPITASASKTVIRDNLTINTIIKQEGRRGSEYIVITKADNFINLSALNNLVPMHPTGGNFISSNKFKNACHRFDPDIDPFIKTKADDIFQNGDISGSKTEEIQDYLFRDKLGLTKLEHAKYGGGSDNGLDGLFIEGTTSNPSKIYIPECKQWNSTGGVQLNTANLPSLHAQLTDEWVLDVAANLRNEANLLPAGPIKQAKIDIANMLENPANLSKFEKIIVVVNKSTKDINLLKVN